MRILIWLGIGYLVFTVIFSVILYAGLEKEWSWLCQPYPYDDKE